jgi:16S rRNA (cytosine967-C5)-methyltransferase
MRGEDIEIAAPTDTPRYAHARFAQAAELLAELLRTTGPADACIDRYFRAHRKMGSQDRAFAAEQVYACLRHRRLLEHYVTAAWPETASPGAAATEMAIPGTKATMATPGTKAIPGVAVSLLAAQLMRNAGWSARALAGLGVDGADELARSIRGTDARELPFAVRNSLPDWLADAIRQQWPDEAESLAQALLAPAPVDLRANTLKTTRDALQAELAACGYASSTTPYSPQGLRRSERKPLFQTTPFREGRFEVQDEGSQLVTLLLAPRPGERVVDFCAGGGGKTLHASALMENRGSVYAFDVSARRLDRMRKRLARAGASNVRVLELANERDPRLQRHRERMDAVLVDAPCTGSGTLRRNPDMKWRSWDFAALSQQQADILAAAARLVRPGGRLVYATCSLLTAENEEVVGTFLASHADFAVAPGEAALAAHGVVIADAATPAGHLQLLPHRHHTDGFFAALLVRSDPAGTATRS